MLGEVVGKVAFAWGPPYLEHALAYTVPNPLKSHVHCFGVLDFGPVVGKAFGCGVIGDDWCGSRLGWPSSIRICLKYAPS